MSLLSDLYDKYGKPVVDTVKNVSHNLDTQQTGWQKGITNFLASENGFTKGIDSANDFIHSGKSLSLPEDISIPTDNSIGSGVDWAYKNLFRPVGNSALNLSANVGIDAGRSIAGDTPQIGNTASPVTSLIARSANKAAGNDERWQDIIGDAGQVGGDVLNLFTPKALTGAARVVESPVGESFIKTLGKTALQEGKTGLKIGLTSGFSQGLNDNRDGSLEDQFLGAGEEGLVGGVVGSAVGAATPVVSEAARQVAKEIAMRGRVSGILPKLDAEVPMQLGREVTLSDGSKARINEMFHPQTDEVPNHIADHYFRTGRFPEDQTMVPDNYKIRGKTTLVHDPNTGKLISWSTDNPDFAKSITGDAFSMGLSTRAAAPSELGMVDQNGKAILRDPNMDHRQFLYDNDPTYKALTHDAQSAQAELEKLLQGREASQGIANTAELRKLQRSLQQAESRGTDVVGAMERYTGAKGADHLLEMLRNEFQDPRFDTGAAVGDVLQALEDHLGNQDRINGLKKFVRTSNQELSQREQQYLKTETMLNKGMKNTPKPSAQQAAPEERAPMPTEDPNATEKVFAAAQKPENNVPEADVSPEAMDRGRLSTMVSDKKGVNNFADDVKKNTQDWINSTRHDTLSFDAQKIKNQFEPVTKIADQLDGENAPKGQQFIRFQENAPASKEEASAFGDIRKYFNDKYQQLTAAGVPVRYQENYLKQMWKGTDEEINQAVDRALSRFPGLSKEKIIANYQEGIKAGLTPKYDNLPDIAAAYEREANRAIADSNFFKNGVESGVFKPKSANGYTMLQHFPEQNLRYEDGGKIIEHSGPVYAPDDLAKVINNYMGKGELMRDIANFSGELKNIVLSGGVPGTSWNFHGITTLGRDALASSNPLKMAKNVITDVAAMTYNPMNKKYLEENVDRISELMHSGLTLSSEAGFGDKQAVTGIKKAYQVAKGAFEDSLFQGFIPATKSRFAIDHMDQLIKKGISREDASNIAAHAANTIFGGNNLAELGTNKDAMNVVRSFFLAPDTYLSLGKTGKGVVKAILNPRDPKYWAFRSVAMNTAAAYTFMNLANKASTGHWMTENAPGHTFEVQMGYDQDGNPRYIRPLGQSLDFLKIPVDAITSIAHGDLNQVTRIAQNRLTPLISQVLQVTTNTNPYGQPITSQDDSATEKIGKYAANATGSFLPSPVSAGARFAAGEGNAEQTAMAALELPVRYGRAASTKDEKASLDYMKSMGMSSDEIGKALEEQRANRYAGMDEKTAMKDGQMVSSSSQNGEADPLLAFKQKYGLASAPEENPDAPIPTDFSSLKRGSSGKFYFKNTDGDLKSYATEKKARQAYAKDLVDSGGAEKAQAGDMVYYTDAYGDTKSYNVKKHKDEISSAQYSLDSDKAKRNDDFKTWSKITNDEIDRLTASLDNYDPTTQMEDILKVENKIADMSTTLQKYSGYHGFTKPKKAKKPKKATASMAKSVSSLFNNGGGVQKATVLGRK